MSDRIDRYCLTCGNVTVADAGYYAGSSFYHCETCGRRGMSDMFPRATVFNQITASPEVLAPQFVYHVTSFLDGLDKPKKIWYSTLIRGRAFASETEAKEQRWPGSRRWRSE